MNERKNKDEKRMHILHEALTQLEQALGHIWKVTLRPHKKGYGDNEVIIFKITNQGQKEIYRAEPIIQGILKEEHIVKNFNTIKDNKSILVAEYIAPKTKKILKEQNIDYLDIQGNCYINEEKKNENIFLNIEGLKNVEYHKEKYNRAFAKTGLKIIYAFLLDQNFINRPYREIAEKTGVALGNLNYVIKGLIEEGFITRKNKNEMAIVQQEELLEKWINVYGEKLKPGLKMGTYRFLNPNDFDHWQKVDLNFDKTCWGGEPAATLWTNYLKPGILTLYTTETKTELIKNYRMIPDIHGNIHAYRKFWKEEKNHENKTNPILTYADLMLTNNMRCIETARMIYEKYIEKDIQRTK
jgi:hypothetical protein